QAEDGIRDYKVTGVQTCGLPIWARARGRVDLPRPGEPGGGGRDGAREGKLTRETRAASLSLRYLLPPFRLRPRAQADDEVVVGTLRDLHHEGGFVAEGHDAVVQLLEQRIGLRQLRVDLVCCLVASLH